MARAPRGRLLITGGHGMVGRNVAEQASARGWTVLTPRRAELDLFDYAATRAYITNAAPDAVVHAAGRVGGIQANVADPVAFLVENVDVGRNVILAARAAGVRTLLNLASSCMYPREACNPLREDMILTGQLEPTNEGYAIAKIVATRLCEYIIREDPAYTYKTLVPCNLYGRYDKFDPGKSHLIPAIIQKVHSALESGEETVEIWGDGLARREFMYAGDAADAVLRALELTETLPAIMNIGVGSDHSVNDYYRVTAEVLGWRGRFVHDLSKPVGMQQKLVSVETQSRWGWAPVHSLRDGIRMTYEYFLETSRR